MRSEKLRKPDGIFHVNHPEMESFYHPETGISILGWIYSPNMDFHHPQKHLFVHLKQIGF